MARVARRILPPLVAGALFLVAPAATGDPGRDLSRSEFVLDDCDPDASREKGGDHLDYMARGFCLGFVGGFLAAQALASEYADTRLACTPEGGISAGQGRRIWVKWLRDHPEHLHRHPRATFFAALSEAFPCEN